MEDLRSDRFRGLYEDGPSWPMDARFSENVRVQDETPNAYQHLKNLLLNGSFRAGEHIDLNWAATTIGVSATPVREALIRLAAERLVTAHPNRGFFYPVPRAETLADEFRFRFGLSSLCWNSLKRNPIGLEQLRQDADRLHELQDISEADFGAVTTALDRSYLTLSKSVHSACVYREMLACGERTLVVRRFFVEQRNYRDKSIENTIDFMHAIMDGDKEGTVFAVTRQLAYDLEEIPIAVERLRSRSFDSDGTRLFGADRA